MPAGRVVNLSERGILIAALRFKVCVRGVDREATKAGPDLLREDVVAMLAHRAVAAAGATFGLDVDEREQGLVPVIGEGRFESAW